MNIKNTGWNGLSVAQNKINFLLKGKEGELVLVIMRGINYREILRQNLLEYAEFLCLGKLEEESLSIIPGYQCLVPTSNHAIYQIRPRKKWWGIRRIKIQKGGTELCELFMFDEPPYAAPIDNWNKPLPEPGRERKFVGEIPPDPGPMLEIIAGDEEVESWFKNQPSEYRKAFKKMVKKLKRLP